MFTPSPRHAIGIASANAIGTGASRRADRLPADQQRDHRQHDGAGESGEVAQLAGAEGEARIGGVPPGVAVGQRREQQRAGMRAHVQAVGDQRDRAEQQAAGDLQRHHRAAQPDHRPGALLGVFMALAEEDVAVGQCADLMAASLEVGANDFEQLLDGVGVQRARMGSASTRWVRTWSSTTSAISPAMAPRAPAIRCMTCSQPASLFEGALDRLDLAADAADAGEQLLLFPDGVGHG